MMPATPAVSPARANATVLIRAMLTQARRAASALLPIACTSRPNRVRFSRNDQVTSTPSTIRMTHGTPRTGLSTPRLMLHTVTTAMPATAATPILATVRPTGGPVGPPRRRSASRRMVSTANRPTKTTMSSQPATGLR